MSRIPFPGVDLPKFDMPKFDMPKFDMPKFELPDFELPSADQLVSVARDAAYAGIGLAAMTVERLQALRTQVTELISAGVARVTA